MPIETLLASDLLDQNTGYHYHYITQIKSVTKLHNHDFFEIFLVAQGTVIHRLQGREERLAEGTLMLIRPNDVHGYLPDGEVACCIANLAFSAEWFQRAAAYLLDGREDEGLIKCAPQRMILAGERLREALRDFHQLGEQNVKEIILRRLSYLLLAPKASNEQKTDAPPWLGRLMQTMENPEHFAGGVKRMAELCDKTPEHMYRMCRRYYHQTPSEVINSLRVEHAAKLLKHTDMAIVDIALEVGFENLSWFYVQFKRRYEKTPQEFRNETPGVKSIPMGE